MLVQDSVSPLSFMSFPVVQSKNTTLLLIAEAGHTTSQPQLPHVASIVTPPNQSSVSVMLVPCIRSNMVCEPLLVQLVLRSIELQPPPPVEDTTGLRGSVLSTVILVPAWIDCIQPHPERPPPYTLICFIFSFRPLMWLASILCS